MMTESEYEELSQEADDASLQGDKGTARRLLQKGLEDARGKGNQEFQSFFLGELSFLEGEYDAAPWKTR